MNTWRIDGNLAVKKFESEVDNNRYTIIIGVSGVYKNEHKQHLGFILKYKNDIKIVDSEFFYTLSTWHELVDLMRIRFYCNPEYEIANYKFSYFS